jgi:hypothetical protein
MNICNKIIGIITNIRSFLKSFELTYEKIYDLIADLKSHGFTNEAEILDGNMHGATGGEVLTDLAYSFKSVLLQNVNITGNLRKKIERIWMHLRIKLFFAGQW